MWSCLLAGAGAEEPFRDADGSLRTGVLSLTFTSRLDDSTQKYALWVPRQYDPQKPLPLVLYLHSRGGDEMQAPFVMGLADRDLPAEVLVVGPHGRGDLSWRYFARTDIHEVLAEVMARYNVDPDRIYVTGESMGAFGTWDIAMDHPDRFAAAALNCGGAWEGGLPNLQRLPFLVNHGDQDDVISLNQSRMAVQVLRGLDAPVELRELPGAGHIIYPQTNRTDANLNWLLQHRRQGPPPAVTYVSRCARFSDAYWVRIDGRQVPYRPARIDARVTAPGVVEVGTVRVSAFTLIPPAELVGEAGVTKVVIDGTELVVEPGAALHFALAADGTFRQQPVPPSSSTVAHNGQGAFDYRYDRVVHVVGTGGAAQAVRQAGQAVQNMANLRGWPDMQGRNAFYRPILKRDVEVTSEDLRDANLVVFGTPAAGSPLASLADELRAAPVVGGGQVGELLDGGPRRVVTLLRPNPLNPQRLVLWVIAADPGDYGYAIEPLQHLEGGPADVLVRDAAERRTILSMYYDDAWQPFEPRVLATLPGERASSEVLRLAAKVLLDAAGSDLALFTQGSERMIPPGAVTELTLSELGLETRAVVLRMSGEQIRSAAARCEREGRGFILGGATLDALEAQRIYSVAVPWDLAVWPDQRLDLAAPPGEPTELNILDLVADRLAEDGSL